MEEVGAVAEAVRMDSSRIIRGGKGSHPGEFDDAAGCTFAAVV